MERLGIEMLVVDQCRANPDWMSTLAAGPLSDLVRTLPPADPWRHLSARISVHEGPDVVRGQIPAPPEHTGAMIGMNGHARAFGTFLDESDRLPRAAKALIDDPGVAALETGLQPDAAAVLAMSGDGWRAAKRALLAVYDQAQYQRRSRNDDLGIGPAEVMDHATWVANVSGRAMAEAAMTAITWAMHRRRTYAYAANDSFLLLDFDRWVDRANRAREAGDLTPEEDAVIEGQVEAHQQVGDDEFLADFDDTDESSAKPGEETVDNVRHLRRPTI